MRTVWKYQLDFDDHSTVDLPKGATVLHFDAQIGMPTIWALVDPEAATEPRQFRFAGTGHPINDEDALNYIGTAMFLDGLVFHLFEVK